MKSSRTPKASKGQAMFLVILALPVIVGVLTLVMDVGNLYFNQVSMQVAIDSGVLSGSALSSVVSLSGGIRRRRLRRTKWNQGQ